MQNKIFIMPQLNFVQIILVLVAPPVVVDVNECNNPSLNDCSPNADCINTDGYYTCTCNSG